MHIKTQFLFLAIIIGLSLFIACKTESPAESEAPAADRNPFGHYIPRGLVLDGDHLMPGYFLFAVPNSASFYLGNRKGEIVHEWKGNFGVLGAYLQADGSLIQSAVDVDFPVITAGAGNTGRLQRIGWDGKLSWDFEYASEEHVLHHDMAILPNGHILAIAREVKTADEVLAAGRKPELTPKAGLWPDMIIEIVPDGPRSGEIVWEWHMWDHLIQDYDPEKDNYGDPAAHPELMDINLGGALPAPISQDSMDRLHALGRARRNATVDNQGSDLHHVNAIDYNAELDQIVFSSPGLGEIFIIDHSTTTGEAAGHKGGRWGRGGDFLYRWGNPRNYQQGDSTHQQLFGQHDVRWIEPGMPGAGNLTVFNNDVPGGPGDMDYSAVYEIKPPTDEAGHYLRLNNGRFGPEKPEWQYIAPDTISFYGSFISGAHRMQNGNTFINEGPKGRFFEVTPSGNIVWEYRCPYRGEIRNTNGDPRPVMRQTYSTFRATFLPADHPGLQGRELVPLDPQPEVFKLPPPQGVIQ